MCAEHNEEINELKKIIHDKLRLEQEEYEVDEAKHQEELDRMKQKNMEAKLALKDKLT